MTKQEQLYNLYVENPSISNGDAAELLGVDNNFVRTVKNRLKNAGYIDYHEGSNGVTVLKPYKESTTSMQSQLKAEIYREMLATYMEDFKSQTTFDDRIRVGREIRLILEKF